MFVDLTFFVFLSASIYNVNIIQIVMLDGLTCGWVCVVEVTCLMDKMVGCAAVVLSFSLAQYLLSPVSMSVLAFSPASSCLCHHRVDSQKLSDRTGDLVGD